MLIVKSPEELQKIALAKKCSGVKIGLVPTMGFLHAGHASLIDIARRNSDFVIVSVFVNPTQFGPTEDLDKYPRDFEHDKQLCEAHGADLVFAPDPGAMYAADSSIWVEETKLSKGLCGRTRPIHFRGVCTVVAKLFNLAQPSVAVFGEKDAQQLRVIKRMVRDLNFPIEIIAAPLVRGEDGLALSSRNRYLTADEHERALVLSRGLALAQSKLEKAGVAAIAGITAELAEAITKAGGKVDYVEALDSYTLEKPEANASELLLAVAAVFGTTRLIDNKTVQLKK